MGERGVALDLVSEILPCEVAGVVLRFVFFVRPFRHFCSTKQTLSLSLPLSLFFDNFTGLNSNRVGSEPNNAAHISVGFMGECVDNGICLNGPKFKWA